jgi:aspartate aminotransferase-like enzyme
MGICSFTDLAACFAGIEGTLATMGHKFDRGAAVEEIAKRT